MPFGGCCFRQLVSMWSTVCNSSEPVATVRETQAQALRKRPTPDLWRLSVAVASEKHTLSSEGEEKVVGWGSEWLQGTATTVMAPCLTAANCSKQNKKN